MTSKLRITASCTTRLFRKAASSMSAVKRSTRSIASMIEVVGKSLLVAGHTGRAFASAVARKLSGKALGVKTSTGTPSSLSSS